MPKPGLDVSAYVQGKQNEYLKRAQETLCGVSSERNCSYCVSENWKSETRLMTKAQADVENGEYRQAAENFVRAFCQASLDPTRVEYVKYFGSGGGDVLENAQSAYELSGEPRDIEDAMQVESARFYLLISYGYSALKASVDGGTWYIDGDGFRVNDEMRDATILGIFENAATHCFNDECDKVYQQAVKDYNEYKDYGNKPRNIASPATPDTACWRWVRKNRMSLPERVQVTPDPDIGSCKWVRKNRMSLPELVFVKSQ